MSYDTRIMLFITGLSRSLVKYDFPEIPVVAAIVRDGRIVSLYSNDVETTGFPWRHAEFCAIESLATSLGNKFLCDCDIYVTLEPCDLCMAMIDAARIRSVYFGAYNTKYGSMFNYSSARLTPSIGGFYESDNSNTLIDYFESMRSSDI